MIRNLDGIIKIGSDPKKQEVLEDKLAEIVYNSNIYEYIDVFYRTKIYYIESSNDFNGRTQTYFNEDELGHEIVIVDACLDTRYLDHKEFLEYIVAHEFAHCIANEMAGNWPKTRWKHDDKFMQILRSLTPHAYYILRCGSAINDHTISKVYEYAASVGIWLNNYNKHEMHY